MNDPNPSPSSNGPGPGASQQSWLSLHWPKCLFAVTGLITLGALLNSLLTHSLSSAPEAKREVGEVARAERAAAVKFIPPPVPASENFAATPFLASVLDRSIPS